LGHLPPPTHLLLPPGRTCYVLLFFDFVEEKTYKIKGKTYRFCLFKKIAIQGDFLCCAYAQVYYNSDWLISTRPLHYFLVSYPY
jgi:hypothetical protein